MLLTAALLGAACSNPERDRIRATSKGTYDPKTGKLTRLTFDKNKNGKIDTWVNMDGGRQLSAEIDADEDGKIDRWEWYGDNGELVRAAESRSKTGEQDMWITIGADRLPATIDYLGVDNDGKAEIARREYYERGAKVRSQSDSDGDGLMDCWETFEKDVLRSAEFFDGKTGKPERRLTYDANGALILTESEPDKDGRYTKRIPR